MMEHIPDILAYYPIGADSIEPITENVAKISDGERDYALKKSKLTNKTVASWEEVYHQAYQYHLHELLPVYMTVNGALAVSYDHHYYLSPWIPNQEGDKKKKMQRLYDTIGSIHAKTKQTVHMDTNEITKQFEQYKKQIDDHRLFLSECVSIFEKSRFMAPVELYYCMHYKELDTLLQTLDDQVDKFIDGIKEASSWNYSLCHGRLDFSHCLIGEHTYIINWENAYHANPVHDLARLYRTVVINYDDPVDDYLQDFSRYMEQNSLTETELSLLAIYLLDPAPYMDLVTLYRKHPDNYGQIHLIQQFQQAYRMLTFSMKWVHSTGNQEIDSTAY